MAPSDEPVTTTHLPASLGIRVTPKCVHYAVVHGPQSAPKQVEVGKLCPPNGIADESGELCWYRGKVQDLITRTSASTVAVRFAESGTRRGSPHPDRKRSRIEGVILEIAATLGTAVYTGPLSTISSRLGTDRAKKYTSGTEFRGLSLPKSNEAKEAVVVAVSGLPGDES